MLTVARKVKSTRNSNFGDYSGDIRPIWRLGDTVQNLESLRLSGRVDSTVCACALNLLLV